LQVSEFAIFKIILKVSNTPVDNQRCVFVRLFSLRWHPTI